MGPAIGSGGHCTTLTASCRPAARKASCRPTGARERDGSTERNICGALHHLAVTAFWTQQLLDEARASGEARVQAVEVERAKELARDRASREQCHQLKLRTLRKWADLLRERATLVVQNAQALLAGSLWQERNQARQDALRYNQELNEARAEVVALRTHQSAAAFRSALAPIFPLSAE